MRTKAQISRSREQKIDHRGPKKKLKVNRDLILYAVSLSIFLSFFLFHQAQAEIQPLEQSKIANKIDSKAKLSVGYDDNVSDRVNNPIKTRFAQLYINSDVNTSFSSKTLFSMKLQDGFKYHDARSLSDESILINKANFVLSHNILERLSTELYGEIRSRTSMHSKGNISPSEESYLRGYSGLAIKTMIFSDLSARFSYNYKATNFEDFDPFDRRGHEFGFRTDVKLLPNSFMSLQYSRELTGFNKWDDKESIRNDVTDIMTIGIQLYKNLLLNISASYENNRSNADGYSYKGYMLSALMAKTISDDIVVELYMLYRSRKHDSPPDDSNSTQIDIEDEERNVVMLKISRDINRYCALEAQYDLRRSRSGIEEGTYIKNVFSASIVSNF